jgi:hypothetical protein
MFSMLPMLEHTPQHSCSVPPARAYSLGASQAVRCCAYARAPAHASYSTVCSCLLAVCCRVAMPSCATEVLWPQSVAKIEVQWTELAYRDSGRLRQRCRTKGYSVRVCDAAISEIVKGSLAGPSVLLRQVRQGAIDQHFQSAHRGLPEFPGCPTH